MSPDEQLNLVRQALKRHDAPAALASPGADQFLTPGADRISQHKTAVHRTPPGETCTSRATTSSHTEADCQTGNSAIHPSPESDSPLARN